MAISDPGRGLVRRLGVTAAALVAFAAASQQRAEALSLASPGAAPSVKYATDGLATEVRHGGGGGGGFRGGGMAIQGGGGGAFRGGGAGFAARPSVAAQPNVGTGFAGRSFAATSPAVAGRSWNGGNWHGGGRHWNGRRWIGPGIGIAAGLAAGAAYGSYYGGYGYYDDGYYGDSYAYATEPEVAYSEAPVDSGDSVAYCQQTYRSYDPASGTYLGYDGLRHPCP